MNNAQSVLKELLQGIQSDLNALRQLRPLLQEQRTLLCQHGGEGLTPLNERHAALVDGMQQRASSRSQLLSQLGCDPNEHGMSTLLERLPPELATRARPLWQQLHQQLQDCKTQNEINGRILAGQQETLRAMLFPETVDYSALAR